MAPYVPPPEEAENYYYGLPSKPRLVARSSSHLWLEPTGLEAYLVPKELTPVGPHHLNLVWESTIGPAMLDYLWRMLWNTPAWIRIGTADDVFPPAIIWIGVKPGSLSHRAGIDVALHCKSVLSSSGIQDVEVEIRESEVFPAGKPYLPAVTFDPIVEGTAAFFFTDSTSHNGKLFLLTTRHILFHPDKDNEFYKYDNPSQPKKEVCLLGDVAFKDRIEAIESAIVGREITIAYLNRRLEAAERLTDQKAANREKRKSTAKLEEAEEAITELKDFLKVVETDWKDLKDRVIGHVVSSPPITFNAGDDGYTEDWAIMEVDTTKIDRSNFVGNAIDLGTEVAVDKLTTWMRPNLGNSPSFEYPVDRLLRLFGTISDDKLRKSSTGTVDENGDATVMVLKRGCTSGLTVGRLNTIRSLTRQYSKDQSKEMSKEIAVLPHSSKSGPFSQPGDFGSNVVNGEGNVTGVLTGGAGAADISDVTYLTSITFLIMRLSLHGFKAHIFPLADDLAA